MQLTSEQIAYIEKYIQWYDIKYYEIYMEILDHMILSVEAILEEDKNITLEKAILKAKAEGFGKMGFRGMMAEKVKLAHKKNAKENHKLIKKYFTFPKIFLSLFIFGSYFLFLMAFDHPVLANLICIHLVVFLGLFQMFYSRKFRKVENKFVLKTQVLNSTFALSYLAAPLANSFTIIGKDSIDFNHILMRLFMTLVFTFSVLAVLVYIEIRKKTIVELQQQIFV